MVTPLVVAWLVLTLVLGVVLGTIVLAQFTLSHVRPVRRPVEQAPVQEMATQPAAARAA